MATKIVKFKLQSGGTELFEIKSYDRGYYVRQWVSTGVFSDNYRNIGAAETFDDALAIARANSCGPIHHIEIK